MNQPSRDPRHEGSIRSGTGKQLAQRYGITVEQPLYRATGNWYHRPTRFPCALFDAGGVIVFATESDLLSCPHLSVNKQIGMRGVAGISEIVGYSRFENLIVAASDVLQLPADLKIPEKTECTIVRIIRDSPLARKVKHANAHVCQVCRMQPLRLADGTPYAEAHHVYPLGAPHHGPDIAENMLCVCPNCHVLLDFGAIRLNTQVVGESGHMIDPKFLAYHNSLIFRRAAST